MIQLPVPVVVFRHGKHRGSRSGRRAARHHLVEPVPVATDFREGGGRLNASCSVFTESDKPALERCSVWQENLSFLASSPDFDDNRFHACTSPMPGPQFAINARREGETENRFGLDMIKMNNFKSTTPPTEPGDPTELLVQASGKRGSRLGRVHHLERQRLNCGASTDKATTRY
jgi:hypothetical protein